MARDNGGIIGVTNNPTSSTATGVWSIESQYQARVGDTWPQRSVFTTKSARFNSGSSDYLTFTPSATPTGSAKTWTYSVWVKMAKENPGYFLAAGSGTQSKFIFGAYGGGDIDILTYEGYVINANTARLFRDPSAWYHVVLACDTTQAVAANGIKLYINGVQETLTFNSQGGENGYTQNTSLRVGTSGEPINIGRDINDSGHWNGYMTEAILVDGQQLAPTSFGVANSDGVWTPIPYTGTFGNNGFKLQFENAAALGTDSSPNGNTFTVNNLTSIDQTTDYPEVNFATANILNVNSGAVGTFTDGNLTIKVANSSGFVFGSSSTIGVSSGKWYCEAKIITVDATMVGVSANVAEDARDNYPPGVQGGAQSVGILVSSGNKYIDDSGTTYGAALSANDILMIALDLDNNNVYFGKNGSWFDGSGNADESNPTSAIAVTAVASTAEGAYFFSFGDGGGSAKGKVSWNFGNAPYTISSGNADGNGYGNFEYAVPSGYYSLNTKNLAEFG